MNRVAQLEDMLLLVAKALGAELSRQVAFVGGSTTGLLVTDKVTQSAIRYTEDVDLIVNVIGYSQWRRLQQQLQARGFSINPEDDVICRMRLGQLKVDFMPDDASILGFSNRWYAEALAQAKEVTLRYGLTSLSKPGNFSNVVILIMRCKLQLAIARSGSRLSFGDWRHCQRWHGYRAVYWYL